MRIGVNPLKRPNFQTGAVRQPAPLTVCTVTYIPNHEGWFQESFEILKICIASIRANTAEPFDLMVFDNGSAENVVDWLVEQHKEGSIQYLHLCDDNVGRVGSWNYLFSCAPGNWIAFTDSDVYFYPGWFEAMSQVYSAFPLAGSVSGCVMPHAFERDYSLAATFELSQEDESIRMERGQLISDAQIYDYADAIGKDRVEYLTRSRKSEQVRLERQGVSAYATCNHWMFLVKTDLARSFLPFDGHAPLGPTQGIQWETRLNECKMMQLSVVQPVVHHLGNSLTSKWLEVAQKLNVNISISSPRVPAGPIKRMFLRIPKARGVARRISDYLFDFANGEHRID